MFIADVFGHLDLHVKTILLVTLIAKLKFNDFGTVLLIERKKTK